MLRHLTLAFAAIFVCFSACLYAHAQDNDETPEYLKNGNFEIGPDYEIDPDLTDQNNPKGKLFQFEMPLADSEIFRGDD